jgi:hypothetical protein
MAIINTIILLSFALLWSETPSNPPKNSIEQHIESSKAFLASKQWTAFIATLAIDINKPMPDSLRKKWRKSFKELALKNKDFLNTYKQLFNGVKDAVPKYSQDSTIVIYQLPQGTLKLQYINNKWYSIF